MNEEKENCWVVNIEWLDWCVTNLCVSVTGVYTVRFTAALMSASVRVDALRCLVNSNDSFRMNAV